MIQSKQSDLATTSTTTIPTVTTTVPSTVAASLAPTAPPTIALPITTESMKNVGTSTEKATKLVKAMEDMSIQAIELKRLKEKVACLETDCKLAQIQQREETQKALRMGEKIKVLVKYLTLQKPLGHTKEIL